MNNFNNVPPSLFSLTAVAIGSILTDNSTPNEQNALGNWLMLIAQYLCTNAAIGQLQQSNSQTPGSFSEQGSSNNDDNSNDTIQMMQKMIEAMSKEIEELKKQA